MLRGIVGREHVVVRRDDANVGAFDRDLPTIEPGSAAAGMGH